MWLDNTAVLRGVDLYVPSGSVTALLGASGAGKSTLIKHLLGLLPPDEGTVAIGDQDIWSSTPAQLLELRRNLSALHSGPTVYDGSVFASLSVRDNLLAVLHEKHANPSRAAGGTGRGGGVTNPYLKLWTEGVPQSDAIPELAERVQWWLDRLDLAEVADQQPHQVSAGLRRRAALGGALAVDVPLYVLDDIDGAIDATHRQIVLDAVLDTHRRTGATMLIATHDVQLARAVADRIAVLAGGRIVFHGSPEEALTDLHRWYRTDDGLVEPEAHPGTIPAARRPSEPLGPHSDAPQRSRTPAAPPSATERVTPRPPRRLLVPTLITATVFAAIVLLFVLAIPRL